MAVNGVALLMIGGIYLWSAMPMSILSSASTGRMLLNVVCVCCI